jgi:hypothetical protein
MRLIVIAAALAVLSGCASNPQQQVALDVATRIAIRHALDTPRAVEKARNIRKVALRVHELASSEVTVAVLATEIGKEIDAMSLTPLERADAKDLLQLLAALIEQQVGSGDLKPEGVVKVTEFADLIVAALPVL